jgi:hypothetical protein
VGGEQPTPPGGKSFWGSLPGILTGIAAVLTAGGTVLGVVLTRGGGTPQQPPTPPVTVASGPETDVPVLPSPDPVASPVPPLEQAPQSGCPNSPNMFWMQFQSVPYGPFGDGYYLAWDAFGFYVWDPVSGWIPYPDPQARNSWVNLTGSPFNGCVAGAGAPVFGQYTG